MNKQKVNPKQTDDVKKSKTPPFSELPNNQMTFTFFTKFKQFTPTNDNVIMKGR
jgi:hypothetical protein